MHALRAMFRDNVKARVLAADGTYSRVRATGADTPCRVQVALQEEAKRREAQTIERADIVFRPSRAVKPESSTAKL